MDVSRVFFLRPLLACDVACGSRYGYGKGFNDFGGSILSTLPASICLSV